MRHSSMPMLTPPPPHIPRLGTVSVSSAIWTAAAWFLSGIANGLIGTIQTVWPDTDNATSFVIIIS